MEHVRALLAHPTLGASLTALVGAPGTPLLARLAANPVAASAAAAAGFAAFCYLAALVTGYWSWVDRLWSIVPVVYACIFAGYHLEHHRLLLMASLTVLWGARLSANFARKGGYSHEEDYRWPILRDWFAKHDPLHPLGREVFQLTFVAFYQHLLLWLLVLPCAAAYYFDPVGRLTALDWALALAFLTALTFETVTDEQQWAFQSAKYALTPAQRARAGGDYARGFRTSGVFRYSRHLNFFCEQLMWWIFYGFSVAAACGGASPLALAASKGVVASGLLNWSALGALLLTGLFQGSTWMTELLTTAKYPAYAAYQRTTSRLLPWAPGISLDSPAGRKLVAEAEAATKKAE